MKLIIPILFLTSFSAYTQTCRTRVDPKRVVLFLDTNKGAAEVATARAAACQRGESFVTVSKPNTETVKAALSQIKASGAKPVSLVVSGHDGGGTFAGDSGATSRADLTQIFNDDFPEFKPALESLYLLGCYTGVKYEVFSWMSTFPNLRLIGGYEGSAPLSSRPAGHDYVRSLMLQERGLAASADAARLRASLERIPNMSALNSAVVVRADNCVDESKNPQDFYFRPKASGADRFQVLDSKDCVEKIKQLKVNTAEFVKYFNGAEPSPADTTAGPLRRIYNFFRGAEHCTAEQEGVPSGDQVLSMLFYPGFSENFALWNADESRAIERELAALTMEQWTAGLDRDLAVYAEKMAALERQIARAATEDAAVKQEMKARYTQLKAESERLLKTPEGRLAEQYFMAHPGTGFMNLPSPPFQETFVKQLIQNYSEQTIASNRNDYIEMGMSSKEILEEELSWYKQQKEAISGFPRTKEGFEDLKKSFWLPTPENMVGKTRKEHLEGVHRLYTMAKVTPGFPGPLRQRIRALSESATTQLNNLRCLPLSWHETNHQKPREAPVCGVAPPSRFPAEILIQADFSSSEANFSQEQ